MHQQKSNAGFTLIEATVAVGIAAILAAIAVPQYNIHIAKTQLAESILLMDAAKPGTVAAIVKQGQCTADGKDLTLPGKYGALVVSGTVDPKAIKNSKVRMATGCIFTYTANTSGVSKLIAGKTVVTDLFNNGTFSKNAATTADEKLLPKALSLLDQDPAGSKITPTVPGGPNITNPGDNGGPSTPNTIPPVGPSNPDPSNPDPSNPDPSNPDPTAPTDPISGDPSTPDKTPDGKVCDDKLTIPAGTTLITLDSKGYSLVEATHYVRWSVNLYDEFVKSKGREPSAGEKIIFATTCAAAFVGSTTLVPAIEVGNFKNIADLTLINFGLILGHGGSGAVNMVHSTVKGGDAINNSSTVKVKVLNYGVVAGGGGFGGLYRDVEGKQIHAGSGGAPYGVRSVAYGSRTAGFYTGASGSWGGSGGDWGMQGSTPPGYGRPGALPGYALKGDIAIENQNTGWWRGREGSSK